MTDLALATTTVANPLSLLTAPAATPSPDVGGDPFAALIATLTTTAPVAVAAPVAAPIALPTPVPAMPTIAPPPQTAITLPMPKGDSEGASDQSGDDDPEDTPDTTTTTTPDLPPMMAALLAVAPLPVAPPKATAPEPTQPTAQIITLQPKVAQTAPEAPQPARPDVPEAPKDAAKQAAFAAVAQLMAAPQQKAAADTPVALALPTDAEPTEATPPAANDTQPPAPTNLPAKTVKTARRDLPTEATTPVRERSTADDRRDALPVRLKLVTAHTPQQAADTALRTTTALSDPAPAALPPTDTAIARTLSVAQDGQWLDSLTKDIAATASGTTLQFRLDPAHLGSLTVQIEHGSDGATVRLHSDNAETRTMLTDAQPRLAAEARAQGLTLKETSVGGQPNDQRQPSAGNTSGWDMGRGGQSPRQPASSTFTTAATQDAAVSPVTVSDDTARYA